MMKSTCANKDVFLIFHYHFRHNLGHDRDILWNDPAIGIAWSIRDVDAILSEKDKRLPMLSHLK